MRFRGMLHFDNCQQHNALVLSQYHCDTRSYMQIETKAMPRSPTNTIQFFQFHAICCCHKCDTWIFNVMMMQKWSIESCAVKEKKKWNDFKWNIHWTKLSAYSGFICRDIRNFTFPTAPAFARVQLLLSRTVHPSCRSLCHRPATTKRLPVLFLFHLQSVAVISRSREFLIHIEKRPMVVWRMRMMHSG